jgi:hypothetical protein
MQIKKKERDHRAYQLLNFWTSIYETWYYIIAPEPTSAAYFINLSHQSVSVCVFPLSLLDNGSGEHISAAANARNSRRIIECVVFCAIHVVSNGSIGLSVYHSIIAK